jgi:hypothetical protein
MAEAQRDIFLHMKRTHTKAVLIVLAVLLLVGGVILSVIAPKAGPPRQIVARPEAVADASTAVGGAPEKPPERTTGRTSGLERMFFMLLSLAITAGLALVANWMANKSYAGGIMSGDSVAPGYDLYEVRREGDRRKVRSATYRDVEESRGHTLEKSVSRSSNILRVAGGVAAIAIPWWFFSDRLEVGGVIAFLFWSAAFLLAMFLSWK